MCWYEQPLVVLKQKARVLKAIIVHSRIIFNSIWDCPTKECNSWRTLQIVGGLSSETAVKGCLFGDSAWQY